MYITITAQKLGKTYAQSSAGFAQYLEKENQGLEQNQQEHFFNQYEIIFPRKKLFRKLMGTLQISKRKNQNFIPLR